MLLAKSPLDVADGRLVSRLWRGVVLLLAIAVDEGGNPALLTRMPPWPAVALSHAESQQNMGISSAPRVAVVVAVAVGLCTVTGTTGELYEG